MSAATGDLFGAVTRSGLLLGVRRVIAMVVTAFSTAIVARSLGSSTFGVYAAGVSAAQLLAGLSDFGFSLVLGRDLAQREGGARRLLSTVLALETGCALLLSLVAVALALSSGLRTTRGQVLIVLLPVILTYGLTATRQYFVARFEVRALALIDVSASIVSGALMMALAAITRSAVAVALAFAVPTTLQAVAVAVLALRRTGLERPDRASRRRMLRDALPLGAASTLSTFYFVIDLALLGWLVKGPQLGDYAAAVKILSVLVALPTLVMSTALPGLSKQADDPGQLNALAARIMQTLATICVPLCVAAAVFANVIVDVALGPHYHGAAALIRILAAAGAVSCLSNVLGMSYVAVRLQRPQVISNIVALVLNVAGNVVLAPVYGVRASAWLTLATELLVAGWALMALRRHLDLRQLAAFSVEAIVAATALCLVGLGLEAWPAVAIPAALAAYVVVLSVLNGWAPGLDPLQGVRSLLVARRDSQSR